MVDLVFNTIKPKGGRTITFKVFCEGLDKLGAYKYPAEFKAGGAAATTPKLVELINKQKVPVSSGTKALANKFHDDKKLYTVCGCHHLLTSSPPHLLTSTPPPPTSYHHLI